MDEKLLLMDEQSYFLEMKSIPGEDAMKTVEMTWHKLSLIKQWQSFRGLTPILKEVLLWVKCYHTALYATDKQFVDRRVNQCSKLHCCLILRNCCSHHPDWSTTINAEARPSTSKKGQQKASKKTGSSLRWWLAFFRNEAFLKSVNCFLIHNPITYLTDNTV